MATGPQISSGSGLRRLQLFAIDTAGYIDTSGDTGVTPYGGFELEGIKNLSPNTPSPNPIQHTGNDRLIAQDFLPPTEGVRADITTAKQNLSADATLTNSLVQTVGEFRMGGLFTDEQGTEIDVCAVSYRQALNTVRGSSQLRTWQMLLFPVCRVVPSGASASEGSADENNYTLIGTFASSTPWGVAFSDADNGFEETQMLRITAENPVMFDGWMGTGSTGSSTALTTTWNPISVAKTKVFVDGSEATVSSVGTNEITLDSDPDDGAKIVAAYETADAI